MLTSTINNNVHKHPDSNTVPSLSNSNPQRGAVSTRPDGYGEYSRTEVYTVRSGTAVPLIKNFRLCFSPEPVLRIIQSADAMKS